MPIIYLSPSTQEWNPYITGSGSEEYNMNLLADHMIPYLNSNAIAYRRNTPDMTAASSIAQANQGYYDFYLALHSNASGQGEASPVRGIIAFYYPGSAEGKRGAELIAANLRKIYPLPDKVRTQATTSLGEVRQPHFPSVLVEIGYHDNYADAMWVEGHMDSIAQQLVRALTEFFGIPFIYPSGPQTGTVAVNYGTLNLRSYPSPQGTVIANIPNGASVTVYGEWQGWYTVRYDDQLGYAAAAYIDV
ncbi:SH3 domain-containing protein [Oscillibacter ruminantium]|uniref:SH3 domain-containing protein n=1 Tax=Oscillibacter ruminantium TaxID=1263547 RepID=UPI0003098B76|nr:N-acetylmuramoyl-L-alanine amidase [Oscillibacter ruminantium]MDN0033114.1 N-acetylmuramoyl-L-alanine amidase [Oscillibacter valericigenes]MEA5041937.1 N-acetylmuramoyl-L-alanine amidase [Oscillibacter ruminantium]